MEFVGFILVVLNSVLIVGAVANKTKKLGNFGVHILSYVAIADVFMSLFAGFMLAAGR